MEDNGEVYSAALAGLLHDVGKFAQRAGWRSGKHAEVGGEFVRQHVPRQWRDQLYPVMGHHDKPLPTYATKVVALADRLSAGERADEESAQPRQLLSIFCRLEAEGQQAPEKRYWPLRTLKMDKKTLFPQPRWEEDAVRQAYKDLWKDFEQKAAQLGRAHAETGHVQVYLESLLLLMQQHCWCVPAAYYRSLPDVSVYDHSRMTAALAACLSGTAEETLERWLSNPRQGDTTALLVGGDISGVQDFIYTITARGATSALRGRSFYLQLLTEIMVRFVLRELGLPITNLIYQGGGAFYLLARPGDAARLAEIQRKVSRILLAHHRGDVYLALAWRPLRGADFYGGGVSAMWTALGEALQEAKQHRFGELGDEIEALFAPQGVGGSEEKQCQACGREHQDTMLTGDDNGVRKCPPCLSYEELGDGLRRADYLWLAEDDPASLSSDPLAATPGGWNEVLAAFGYRGGVAEKLTEGTGTHPRLILALKDEALDGLEPDGRTAVGRRFLVNVTPIITQAEIDILQGKIADLPAAGSVKPFAVMEAQSTGIKRLGVLRMDVDDLGKLFSEGFVLHHEDGKAERIATLTRVASLSFAVSLYFEGWVERIAAALNEHARKGNQEGDALYSVYSGGDDLFFVGAWDVVVELACRVRRDLTDFAAGHPGIHACAGIALVGGKYPLYQAAQDAGAAERSAKSLKWHDGERERSKDAVNFLGRTLPWIRFGVERGTDKEPRTTYALTESLRRMVKGTENGGERVPQTLLRRLIQVQRLYESAAEERRRRGEELSGTGEEQVYWGPWMWRGYYFLKRMADRYKDDRGKAIDGLAESLHGDRFRAIEWIGLAARWADLLTR